MSVSTDNCPKCGALLPRDAPKGMCPECLLLGGFEESDASEPGAPHERTIHIVVPLDESAGTVPETLRYFGDYELLEQIAVGGMGVVFKARQVSLNRIVAVKMIRAGQLAREADIRRFRTEAEAAANLKHPRIVAIHEVGEHEGRHFFSMDFIEGRTLAELVRNHPLEPARAARLMQTIAEAIAYAHQRGVLHRDLKPPNVMIDAQDEPHVTDFGLAKMLKGDSELTQTGAVMGSPSYMSPEQARGRGDEVSERSDVYALGAMLYELLTTRPPFLAATPLETMKLVVERDPASPRVLNPALPRDLETICLKCLEKEPARRYASAGALAEDLQRWQRHEPIHARPTSVGEHVAKWATRHPSRAALLALSLLAPAIIIILLVTNERRVTRERDRALGEAQRAQDARAETRQSLYASDMLLAQHALDEGNLSSARSHVLAWKPARAGTTTNALGTNSTTTAEETWLTEADGLNGDIETIFRRSSWFPLSQRMSAWQSAVASVGPTNQAPDDPRGFEWRYLWQQCQGDEEHTLRGHTNSLHCLAFSRDGKLLASGDGAGHIFFWSMRYRELDEARKPLLSTGLGLLRISFSADEKALATTDNNGRTKVWNLATRKVVWSHQGRRDQESSQLSPTGNWIGVSHGRDSRDPDHAAQVFDWKTGRKVLSVPLCGFAGFSPDGQQALVGFRNRTEFWNLATGHFVRTVTNITGSVVPSPDGRYLAGIEGGLWIADLLEAKRAMRVRLAGVGARHAAFAPDGALLAITGNDQAVRLWDVAAQQARSPLMGHNAAVNGVAFSPDGLWLVTASSDKTLKIWSTQRRRRQGELIQSGSRAAETFIASPDGRTLASLNPQTGLWLFDMATRESVNLSHDSSLRPEFFSADSRTFIARGAVNSNGFLPLLRWNVSAPSQPPETVLLPLGKPHPLGYTAVSPERSLYAVNQTKSNAIAFWNPLTGTFVNQWRARPNQHLGWPACFSPDGRKLLTTESKTVFLFEIAAPDRQWTAQFPAIVHDWAFSPDGKMVLTACEDHTIRLFDADTLNPVAVLPGHQFPVRKLVCSPDGRTLASSDSGDVVKLWSMAARREVATVVRGNCGGINSLGFTPDGSTLWAGSWSGEIRLWRVPTLAELDRPR